MPRPTLRAVIATFERIRVPRRLSTLIESESLFNDGMAIVVFVMAISALHHGFDPSATVVSFVAIVVVSGLIGLVAGFIGSRLIAAVDDRFIELAVSVTVAYGACAGWDRGLDRRTSARKLGRRAVATGNWTAC